LLKALSSRIIAGDVLVTEEIKMTTPKTKEFVTFLKSQTEADKVLVISTHFDEVTYKAARNVQPILLNTASEVNTEQLLAFQKIIVTNEALAKLAERLA
jgi:large subunit ribosomal protein L4